MTEIREKEVWGDYWYNTILTGFNQHAKINPLRGITIFCQRYTRNYIS